MAIETFRERTVKDSGQDPGFLQVSYDPNAFGAQVGRAVAGLGETSMNVGSLINQLDKDKRGNDALNYFQKAKDQLRPTLYDSTYGVYATQGGNAMGSGATVNAATDNIQKQYLEQIKDPETKRVFEKLWGNEVDNVKDKTALHEMNELGNYRVETAKTVLSGSITDAYNNYNDPKAIQRAQDAAMTAIDANQFGLPPEAIAAAKAEARSNIALAAISRWAGEDPYKALDFYNEHKDDLSGKDHIVANNLVNTARDTRKAAENATRIKSGGTQAVSDIWPRLTQAETGGNSAQISPKGAIGKSQLLIGTARDTLNKLGRSDLAGLDDASLTDKLLHDDNLNETIGRAYLNEQLNTFGGDIEAALVAYNAGPGNAQKFLAANVGRAPGQRTYDVEGAPGLKSETEGYVQKILGSNGGSGMSTPPGFRMTRDNWSLKHFKPEDIMAPTAGGQWVDARAAQGLDTLYETMEARFPGLNISVNEKGDTGSTAGHRRGTADPADNPHVSKSQHLVGRAFDVQTQSWSDEQKAAFIGEARKIGFTGFGFYGPNGHLHIDMGNARTWGAVPSWAVEPLKVPVGKGPGFGSSAEGYTGAADGTADLPSSSTGYFGMGAQNPGGAFASTKSQDLAWQLSQADLIPDPGERERTKAILRTDAAQAEQDNKSTVAALKQSAWDEVLNSTKVQDLPKELLAQLEPSFVSSLYSYQENRAKGQMPMDWKAWAQIPTDPQELARVDAYTEYRNKLDDEHFDRLLTLQREAIKQQTGESHDSALLGNTRTSSQILKDIADAQGWKSNTSAGATAIAEFNQKMDQRIIAQQALDGKPLDATGIQDIADKLLIEDKATTLGFGGQGQAQNVTKPDDFIAASDWTQVQPDDQKTLTDQYEYYYGSAPDQEAATDLYNRAMRVWLGGQPDGPDDEQKDFRTRMENKLGRPVSDRQFNNLYSKWLVSFLGGRPR